MDKQQMFSMETGEYISGGADRHEGFHKTAAVE
jgi:hypothetical protein